jgi:hypothetical protein
MSRAAPLSSEVCPFQIIVDPHARTAAIHAEGYRGWDGTCPPGFLFEQGLFLKPSEWLALMEDGTIH